MAEENKDIEQTLQEEQIQTSVAQESINNTGVNNTGVDNTGVDNTGIDNAGVDNTGVDKKKEETPQAKNFRTLREQKEKAESERNELFAKLSEYEKNKKVTEEESDEINIGPDDFAEGKHLTKVGRKIKRLEQEIIKQREESRTLSVETRLKAQYPDFDKVVSKDNIEILKNTYPEVAQTLNNDPDIYSKAVSAYTLIKKLGVMQEDNYIDEKDKILQNSNKPRPLTSVSPQQGSSPLHKANAFAQGLTEDLKKQLYQEMLDARKNY